MEAQHGALLGAALAVVDVLLFVGGEEERQRGAVGAGRRLDHVRQVAAVVLLVVVAEVLAGELLCWARS